MRQLPPRRMSPMGLAVGLAAAQAAAKEHAQREAAFDEQLREANLKLPTKEAMRTLARQMQDHLEVELKRAVERFLGEPLTDPERQVKGRLVHAQPQAQGAAAAATEACTIYAMDGVAILKAGPQVLERRGDEIHAFQLVEQLLPEDYLLQSRHAPSSR